MDNTKLGGPDVLATNTIGAVEDGRYVRLDTTDDAKNFINGKIDPSFDMIYIRIHGRTTGDNTRLHYNMAANQEVTFSSNTLEGRFMTPTVNAAPKVQESKDGMHTSSAHGQRDITDSGP